MQGPDQAYAIYVQYSSGKMQVDLADAAAFRTWRTILATGKAEFDPQGKLIRVAG